MPAFDLRSILDPGERRAEGSHGRMSARLGGMDGQETHSQSFVVKIWLEETIGETGRATWRGRITHVRSGEYRYFQYLDDLVAYIVPYLIEMGVKFGVLYRLRMWIYRRRRS
jgi:hypothetical protein